MLISPSSRSQTPVSEANDNASAADSIGDTTSISANRIKRTEVERKQYFENEPECASCEPHSAFCARCKEWVKLSTRQTFYVKPWEVHRVKCDKKVPAYVPLLISDIFTGLKKNCRGVTWGNLGLVPTIPFVVPRSEKIRKQLLELDEHTDTVEPDRIKCDICQEWVPLEKKYNIKCWTRHEAAHYDNLK